MADKHIISTHAVHANDIDFTYFECGSGPLALCLHGFPDSAHTWRHVLPELANAGYRAVAPFMRGYAPTSVAANGAYQTAALSTDANALHDVLGADSRAVIIGTTGVRLQRTEQQFLNHRDGNQWWECLFRHGARWAMRSSTT